ncbi:MAG: DUF1292 domain-containing protein [Clostridia bacterium]|nr:DUF1292 domain-containing protein [Clostridia bacterium]
MGTPEEREVSMVEALLDPNNNDLIRLYDEDDNATVFRQVAVTNINGSLFAILKPEEEFEGLGEDEALVFALEENDEGNVSLLLVTDEETVNAVFEDYYNLLRESGIEVE